MPGEILSATRPRHSGQSVSLSGRDGAELDHVEIVARAIETRGAVDSIAAPERVPRFPVAMVGSWPRPPEVLAALGERRALRLTRPAFERVANEAIRELIFLQERVGVDIVTDGELRRDDFVSFIADKVGGIQVMTPRMSEGINHPSCVGRLERREALAVEELRFVRTCTRRPVKVALPGPYLLTRSMFVPGLSRGVYDTDEELAADIVQLLRDELRDLAREGAGFVQFDEPGLAELVFAQGRKLTFTHAASLIRPDPGEELEFAASLLNRVVDGVAGVRTGVHVCRGNWSKNESVLLSGTYRPLAAYLERVRVHQLVLEYATHRAGDLVTFSGKELGLGVVNPRADRIEAPAEIRRAVEHALRMYPPGSLFLNPDCGFSAFAERPLIAQHRAVAKLQAIVEAARQLRARVMPIRTHLLSGAG